MMTPEKFERAGKILFGPAWKPRLANALKIDVTSVWRYASGQINVPGPVETAIRLMLWKKRHTAKRARV